MTKTVVGELCQMLAFTQFEIQTRLEFICHHYHHTQEEIYTAVEELHMYHPHSYNDYKPPLEVHYSESLFKKWCYKDT